METMERDPAYLAQQVKFLRKWHGLTQENVANGRAGLTTRTIEKVESGRQLGPSEQTLRSLARAFQIDVSIFRQADALSKRRGNASKWNVPCARR